MSVLISFVTAAGEGVSILKSTGMRIVTEGLGALGLIWELLSR